jgi:hypothetical protein
MTLTGGPVSQVRNLKRILLVWYVCVRIISGQKILWYSIVIIRTRKW